MTRAPVEPTLESLDLMNNPIGDEGVILLADWPAIPHVRRLILAGHTGMTAAGAEALAESPYLAKLESLTVDGRQNRLPITTLTRLRERFTVGEYNEP